MTARASTASLECAGALARFSGVELLEPEHSSGRPARFTTRELLDVERETLELAIAGRDAGAPRALPGRTLMEAGAALSEEQRKLVGEGCLSPDRVVCAVGSPAQARRRFSACSAT